MLLIFSELGSTGNNVRGAGEQAQRFGDLDNPANKSRKNLNLKEKPSFCLIF